VILTLLLACSMPGTRPPAGAIEEKPLRQVAFLIMDGVYNTELTAPMDIFHHTAFHTDTAMHVFTVAKTTDPVRTFEGLRILPDYSYLSSDLPKIDILVVPSAEHHLDTDLEDREMIEFVRQAGNQADYVLSLCDGAFVLAQAGLLNGHESTTFPGDIETYQQRFPHLRVHADVLFVHDDRFITSAGGARSFEPALYLVEYLYGKKCADGIARGMVIDWDLGSIPRLIVR
jgi:transcriptional regulator GlxA family with amidase domain